MYVSVILAIFENLEITNAPLSDNYCLIIDIIERYTWYFELQTGKSNSLKVM